jgi:hypothetical protein
MLTNTNTTIPHVSDDDFREAWARAMYQGTKPIADPGAVVTTTIPGSLTDGIWSQMRSDNRDVYVTTGQLLIRIEKLELNEKLLRLKVLGLEGKFTQEEISNIKKMIMSEDEGSKTLADSIIENA